MREDVQMRLLRVALSLEKLALWESMSEFEKFGRKFGDFAVATGDRKLISFADDLVGFSDYMRKINPIEFAQHFLRQTSRWKKAPHYRMPDRPIPPEQVAAKKLWDLHLRVMKSSPDKKHAKIAKLAADFLKGAASSLVPERSLKDL